MQLKFPYLIVIFSFVLAAANAQNLKIGGKVNDNRGQGVVSATLQLKDARTLNVLAYTFSDHNGFYGLSANIKPGQSIYLIVSCLGFKRDTLMISDNKTVGKQYDFQLKNDENQLSEITIKAAKPAIQIVNDTTKYTVSAFTTPENKSLEEVIRKLPGMEVTKDGTIYYKQKQISKVLLEGDDLTGNNYKSITQNLKPGLVDEVQAIEHWVEDDLLKGIINSDDIVLNLTLKDKRKQKIIGSSDLAYGTNKRNDLAANMITFVKNVKAYAFIRNNNIGVSQEDIFKITGANKLLLSDGKLITHQIYPYTPFDGNALALNNTLSGSLNSIIRLSTNFKVSTSLYALRNKLSAASDLTNIYYEPINTVTSNQQQQETNHQQYQADINTDYLINNKSRFTSKFTYKFRPQDFTANALSTYNNVKGDVVRQFQHDRLNNYNLDLKYTLKSSANAALIISSSLVKDKIDQQYHVNSTLYSSLTLFNNASDLNQTSGTSYLLAKADIQALKKAGRNYFYSNIGAEYNQTQLNTNLLDNQSGNTITGFLNNNQFTTSKLYLTEKYTYDNKSLLFYTMVRASLVKQQYVTDSTFIAIEPEIGLRLGLTQFQSLTLRYNYKNTLANPVDYYSQPILADLRSIITGLNQPYNFGEHSINLYYSNSEFNDKYLTLNLNGRAQFMDGGFITDNFFSNTIYYTQKAPYKGGRNFSGNAGLQKFIPLLFSKISLAYAPSYSTYYGKTNGIVNNFSSLTNVITTSAGTGFKLPVNFTLEFQYQNTKTRLEKNLINTLSSYKYGIVSRYQITKTLFNLIDFSRYKVSNTNYNLLNTQIQYTPSKGIFSFAVYGKNLTNIKSITNFYVSNVGESSSNSSILGRYILGSVSVSIK